MVFCGKEMVSLIVIVSIVEIRSLFSLRDCNNSSMERLFTYILKELKKRMIVFYNRTCYFDKKGMNQGDKRAAKRTAYIKL